MIRCLVFVVVIAALFVTVPAIARQAMPGTPAAPVSCDDAKDANPIAATPATTPAATPAAPTTGPVYTTGPVTIHLTDAGFVPDRILSAVGHDLTLTLINTGTRPHNFCSEPLDLDLNLAAGDSTTIELNDLPLGEYPFVSDLPEDAGMRGRLTIFI